jgi:predicted nucleotidyltransferase component of viral defense system
MIENIRKYASTRGITQRDALQAFMQVIVLKNLHHRGARLIGGTALVMGHSNPRCSEDVDLTGVVDPSSLEIYVQRSAKEISGLINADSKVSRPKKDRVTWRIECRVSDALFARLHVDSQSYPAITSFPLMVEYPGVAPFVFPSVAVAEIMADKIVAMAFRKYLGGRDVFDLWYHWLKGADFEREKGTILEYVDQKLSMRGLKKEGFAANVRSKFGGGITKRMEDEWSRYLPAGLKNRKLYDQIFETVDGFIHTLQI